MSQLKHGIFNIKELKAVPPPNNPCILKSGGPIMDAIQINGTEITCQWDDGYAKFHKDMLYSLTPFKTEHLK